MNSSFRASLALVILPFLASLAQAETTAPAQESKSISERKAEPRLTSTVFEWDKLPVQKTANGERREIVAGQTPTLAQFRSHVTTLNPGLPWSSLEKHTDEEVVIVKEGTLEYEINGHTQTAGAGSVVLVLAGDIHRLRNSGTTPVTYFVFHAVTAEAKAAADRTAKLAAKK